MKIHVPLLAAACLATMMLSKPYANAESNGSVQKISPIGFIEPTRVPEQPVQHPSVTPAKKEKLAEEEKGADASVTIVMRGDGPRIVFAVPDFQVIAGDPYLSFALPMEIGSEIRDRNIGEVASPVIYPQKSCDNLFLRTAVELEGWKTFGIRTVILGRAELVSTGKLVVDIVAVDLEEGERVAAKRYTCSPSLYKVVAEKFSADMSSAYSWESISVRRASRKKMAVATRKKAEAMEIQSRLIEIVDGLPVESVTRPTGLVEIPIMPFKVISESELFMAEKVRQDLYSALEKTGGIHPSLAKINGTEKPSVQSARNARRMISGEFSRSAGNVQVKIDYVSNDTGMAILSSSYAGPLSSFMKHAEGVSEKIREDMQSISLLTTTEEKVVQDRKTACTEPLEGLSEYIPMGLYGITSPTRIEGVSNNIQETTQETGGSKQSPIMEEQTGFLAPGPRSITAQTKLEKIPPRQRAAKGKKEGSIFLVHPEGGL